MGGSCASFISGGSGIILMAVIVVFSLFLLKKKSKN